MSVPSLLSCDSRALTWMPARISLTDAARLLCLDVIINKAPKARQWPQRRRQRPWQTEAEAVAKEKETEEALATSVVTTHPACLERLSACSHTDGNKARRIMIDAPVDSLMLHGPQALDHSRVLPMMECLLPCCTYLCSTQAKVQHHNAESNLLDLASIPPPTLLLSSSFFRWKCPE